MADPDSLNSFLAFEPIHSALVFLLFRHKPESLLKFSIIRRKAIDDFSEPSKTRVVSSAY